MTEPDAMLAELASLLASPLDPVLSDPTRLRIQAALHALPTDTAMSFTILRKALMLTDGNLGTHLHVLADAGFAGREEQWRGKRRTTLYRATNAGRAAFEAHVRALNAIIEASAASAPDGQAGFRTGQAGFRTGRAGPRTGRAGPRTGQAERGSPSRYGG